MILFQHIIGTPAENMATDFWMLEHFCSPHILFRHYDWSMPAYSFGYSQKYEDVLHKIENKNYTLCRRPTGGGIVEHTNDWTYTLVIPSSHSLHRTNACTVYKIIHKAIATSLNSLDIYASLTQKPTFNNPSIIKGICFSHPEIFDIINKTGQKIAGAAQKRTHKGLLIQGSINKITTGPLDYDEFYFVLIKNLQTSLNDPTPQQLLPLKFDFPDIIKKFESISWNKKR